MLQLLLANLRNKSAKFEPLIEGKREVAWEYFKSTTISFKLNNSLLQENKGSYNLWKNIAPNNKLAVRKLTCRWIYEIEKLKIRWLLVNVVSQNPKQIHSQQWFERKYGFTKHGYLWTHTISFSTILWGTIKLSERPFNKICLPKLMNKFNAMHILRKVTTRRHSYCTGDISTSMLRKNWLENRTSD